MHILDESEIEKTFVERDPDVPGLPASQPAPSPTRPIIGRTRIGFGLVVDTIGVGGMASVYKVWNERLELFRAVKMLSIDTQHARFETEAKITAKLRHPHIVEVYGVGEWNGVPYMEMEYVDGCNMQEALEARGRFPDAVCCAAGLCVASALDYAHTLRFTLGGNSYDGIIHRDLKPANILVSKRSEIKLTDFGIARPAQAGLHTIDGNIVGTLHYLSPEQLGGGKIDPRSDIYSFGAILYEMATGVKAFPQKSITELTMHRAANSFKPPNEYDTPVAPAISNIIMKCLKASAQDRYRSAAELIRDLRKTYAEIAPKCAPQKTLYEFFSGDAEDAGVTPTRLMFIDTAGTDVVNNISIISTDVNVDVNMNVNNDDVIDTDIINTDISMDVNMDISTDVNTDISTDVNTDDVVDMDISTGVNTDDVIDMDINTSVNTDVSIDTDVNTDDVIDSVKRPFKFPSIKLPTIKFPTIKLPPTKRTTAYASAALLAILSASYLTVKPTSHPSPKPDNRQTAPTPNLFPDPVNKDTASAAEGVSTPVNTHTHANAAANNTNAAVTVNTIGVDTTDVDTADVNTADVNTTNVNNNDVNTIDTNINTAAVNTAAVHPKAAPVAESALIKSAAEAIDRKEWDRAIRALEKDAAFTERRGERHLLLFEAYVESRQLEKARTVFDSAARTGDALYFLTAGRYCFYRGDRAGALAALEASLTRSSALRGRGAVFGDAMYYIALIRSDRFKASPTEANRKLAQEAWRRVKSAYESKQEAPQFKRAEAEILELY